MKDFEKRIIELCKTTNVEKILTITNQSFIISQMRQ